MTITNDTTIYYYFIETARFLTLFYSDLKKSNGKNNIYVFYGKFMFFYGLRKKFLLRRDKII